MAAGYKHDIYLAGPFFNDEERERNARAAKILRNRGFDVFVPREHFIENGETMPNDEWGKAVFKMDEHAILDCKYMVVLYDGMYSDTGTAWEVGYGYAVGSRILVVCTTSEKTSLMVVNGACSVIYDVDELKEFDFKKFTPNRCTLEQK